LDYGSRLLVTGAKIDGTEKAMANVTCQIRYTLDLSKPSAFESYARTWIVLIERYGGTHHGYFIPRASPDRMGVSFPGLGYDGRADVAVAMFSFPDDESYRHYREMVATDPERQTVAALVRETGCFIRYERLFLEPVKRPCEGRYNRPFTHRGRITGHTDITNLLQNELGRVCPFVARS